MDALVNLARHRSPNDVVEVIHTKPSALPIVTEGKLTLQTIYDEAGSRHVQRRERY